MRTSLCPRRAFIATGRIKDAYPSPHVMTQTIKKIVALKNIFRCIYIRNIILLLISPYICVIVSIKSICKTGICIIYFTSCWQTCERCMMNLYRLFFFKLSAATSHLTIAIVYGNALLYVL